MKSYQEKISLLMQRGLMPRAREAALKRYLRQLVREAVFEVINRGGQHDEGWEDRIAEELVP